VIALTRPNGATFYLNPEQIQTVEATPDTVITLLGGKKMVVKEPPQEVSARFTRYRRATLAAYPSAQE